MFKRIAIAVTAVLALLVFAACGSSVQYGPSQPTATSGSTSTDGQVTGVIVAIDIPTHIDTSVSFELRLASTNQLRAFRCDDPYCRLLEVGDNITFMPYGFKGWYAQDIRRAG